MPRTLTRSPCLDAALEYARRGWAAIPICPPDHANCRADHVSGCGKPGKLPLNGKGWQTKKLAFEQLTAYWTTNPTANVGVVMGPMSNLVALDIDGPEGAAVFDELCREYHYEPASFQFSTGNGHRILFSIEEGEDPSFWKLTTDDGRELMCFQTSGHQSVMPPSAHASANGYCWIEGCRPGDGSLDPAPEWLRDLNPTAKKHFRISDLEKKHGKPGRSDPQLPPVHDPLPAGEGPGDDHVQRLRGQVPGGNGRGPGSNGPADRRPSAESRARAYLKRLPHAVSGANGHGATYTAANALVHGFGLDDSMAHAILLEVHNPTCLPPWSPRELLHKVQSARSEGAFKDLLNEPRRSDRNGAAPPKQPESPASDDPGEEPRRRGVATAADLILAGSRIEWIWEGWIAKGMLLGLAAEPGCGKTRFCSDLARRIYLGLPWPDGTPATLPIGSKVMWIASDNQHPELAELPGQMGYPPEKLLVNASPEQPYEGTMLDDKQELDALEARILEGGPSIVFLDTSTQATKRGVSKAEDATAFFVPLAEICRRTGVPIVCVTHLNANGQALGKRILGAVRIMIAMDRPDPHGQPDRRKLVVVKNNLCKIKPALGVTMKTEGNDYDDTPPEKAEEPGGATSGEKVGARDAAAEWLTHHLPGRVFDLRRLWEADGHSTKTIYLAARQMNVVEDEDDKGKKCWSLPTS